ncbi:hypothetical protein C5167_008051 [Papaver somniferum]|uniref:Uncharacterized protein n=1 Tax=Papaver somniferum TaxID=3469 RepID=A0A4Y7JX57_PAPSO|nr:hypothetical protein C5167_008051 [Papaver somniferum]
MGRGGAVPGGVQNHVQKEFPPSKKDDIEILHTETLVKEVDRVFRGSHLDPLEMDMAEKVLKDQEQALIDAIESLDSEDDSKILKTRTQHTSICDKAVKTKQSCNKLGQILEWATTQNGIGNKTLDDIELFHTDTLVKEVERVFRSHPDPLELDMAIKVLKNQEQALIDAIESLNSEDDSKILKFNQPEPGLGKLERRGGHQNRNPRSVSPMDQVNNCVTSAKVATARDPGSTRVSAFRPKASGPPCA